MHLCEKYGIIQHSQNSLRNDIMNKNMNKNIYLLKILAATTVLCYTTVQLSGCAAVAAGSAVTTGAMITQDRRTNGTIVEDKSIEFKATKATYSILDKQSKPNIKVVSYNNNVLLLGQAPNAKMRSEVEQSIKKIAKVRSVHNEIKVEKDHSLKEQANDAWITTKIKSEMLLTKHFKTNHVKVVTEGGVVYLLGILHQSEDEIAVNIARHTKGVVRVVKMFEYLPS